MSSESTLNLLGVLQDYTEPMYAMLVTVLAGIGCLGIVYFFLVGVVRAFKVHIGWGLLCLFVPMGFFVFVIMKWDSARTPFKGILKAVGIVLLAFIITQAVPQDRFSQERAVTQILK